jgi:hypothetical protein
MATGNSASMTTQQTMNQALPRAAPTPVITQGAISPPSKRELASWWKKFRKTEKEDEKRGSFIFLELQGRSEASLVGSNQLYNAGTFYPSSPKQASRIGNMHLRMSMLIVEQLLYLLESSVFL